MIHVHYISLGIVKVELKYYIFAVEFKLIYSKARGSLFHDIHITHGNLAIVCAVFFSTGLVGVCLMHFHALGVGHTKQ